MSRSIKAFSDPYKPRKKLYFTQNNFLSPDNLFSKPHYVKGTAKAGQVFRLLAVFQDGSLEKSYTSQKDPLSGSGGGREKERGRYAQLVGENRQVRRNLNKNGPEIPRQHFCNSCYFSILTLTKEFYYLTFSTTCEVDSAIISLKNL